MSGTNATFEDAVPEAFDRWRPPARHLIPCYGSLRSTSRWRILIRSFWPGVLGALIAMTLQILIARMSPAGSVPKNPLYFFVSMLLPLVVCLFLGIAWLLRREWRLADTPDVQYVLREEAVEKICPHCRLDPFICEGCCRDFPRG